ncbi:glycosyltransferase [Maridesulfovibrio hydrothermalis]|uniref:Glycosyl transferase, group 1 family protein n=1 Tax=Maridesulfovibrio hydrothermalis AM13 = DSM 14728 TaxID=1121451 RepID=L0R8B1_9BACT|nr:glycosyltransferase [Maridesulfovibrio hydrothermalis]CCO22984.1 Glycosyl transferase, group 1 family protein [Maridesulfovibrio hydrothermalis AM13 = DSM 14728]
MKIAYVIGGLPFGGVENWLLDLSLRFKDRSDVDSVVINVSGTGIKAAEYAEKEIRVVDICDSKKGLKTFKLSTALKLRKVLKDEAPDVIHTLHFSGDYFGRLAAVGLGIPVVTHIRNIHRQKKKFRRFANKFLCRFTDVFLSVSGQVEKECVALDHNVCGKPSLVFYNAADPEKLKVDGIDLKKEFGAGDVIISGVGRFVPQKNFDLLIHGFARVVEKYPQASLVLLGDGAEREKLEKLVKYLKIEDKVIFPGYRSDVPRFMRSTDILVMPSDYEGLPITHIEALFCGVPAIISRFVPSLEIASEASLLCRREPAHIAELIISLIDNKDLHTKLSEKAREIAPEYSMDNYVERLVGFYKALVKNGKNGKDDFKQFDQAPGEKV